MFGDEEIEIPQSNKIIEDMEARADIIKFDLTETYWEEHPEEFWELFDNTSEILVPYRHDKWIIGQPEAVEKIRLNLIEWPKKLDDLSELAESGKNVSQILKERPGPYILLIGEPGTGKSLLIKIAAEYLEELYKKEGIELYDVLAIQNPYDKYEPHIRYAKSGDGRKIVDASKLQFDLGKLRDKAYMTFLYFIMLFGAVLLISGILMFISLGEETAGRFQGIYEAYQFQFLLLGLLALVFPGFIIFMRAAMGQMGSNVDEGKNIAALLVDNSNPRYWIDGTVANSQLLFGDVEWDRWGTSKAPHHRLKAGDTQKSHRKLLYIDEIKNLKEEMAIELLGIMEDGASYIKGHQGGGGGATASQMVKSESKIGCMFFLIAAGNMDVLNEDSVLMKIKALYDRFDGYGDIIYMEDEMDDTSLNRMKVAQVITDECYRFNWPDVDKGGVEEVISYMRRRASSNKKLKMRWRRVIGLLRRAAQFVWDTGDSVITRDIIRKSIDWHRPVREQIVLKTIERNRESKILLREGMALGSINGLSVVGYGDDKAGDCFNISAYMEEVDDPDKASFELTGIKKSTEETWIEDSKKTVRTCFRRLYKKDLETEYYVQIAFTQQKGVDGPSAGCAMTLALMSLQENKPLRQDVAITGTVEIMKTGDENDIRVGPIGGAWEKSMGAKDNGMNLVIIPKENLKNNLDETIQEYIEVVSGSTVREYFDILREVPDGS